MTTPGAPAQPVEPRGPEGWENLAIAGIMREVDRYHHNNHVTIRMDIEQRLCSLVTDIKAREQAEWMAATGWHSERPAVETQPGAIGFDGAEAWNAQPVAGTLTEAHAALVDELEAASERFTRYTNNPVDGLLQAAADAIRDLSAAPVAPADVLREALRELLESWMAEMPSSEDGREAQDAWADRRAAARNNAAAILALAATPVAAEPEDFRYLQSKLSSILHSVNIWETTGVNGADKVRMYVRDLQDEYATPSEAAAVEPAKDEPAPIPLDPKNIIGLNVVELPPLPEADWTLQGSAKNRDGYTASQMRDYARTALATIAAEPVAPATGFLAAKAERDSEYQNGFIVGQREMRAVMLATREPVEGAEPAAFLCRIWGEDIDHTLVALVPDWEGVRRFCVEQWTGGEDATDYDGSLTLDNLKNEFDEHEADQRGGAYVQTWEIGGVSIERICDCTPTAPASAQAGAVPVSDEQLAELWTSANENPYSVWRDRIRAAIAKAEAGAGSKSHG